MTTDTEDTRPADTNPDRSARRAARTDALLARLLVEAGLADEARLAEARGHLAESGARGHRERLAAVLVARGALSPRGLLAALGAAEDDAALLCRACGQAFFPPGATARTPSSCPMCDGSLEAVAPAEAYVSSPAATVLRPPSSFTTATTSSRELDAAGEPFGRYRLLAELGRGGMGAVYKAWDGELRRIVALKTLLPESTPGGEGVERFLREARSAARLRHPGIVQVHDAGTHEGRHFFTMDYIDGESLASARGRLPLRRLLEVLRDAALALHAAHEAGVVHRDVKPGNVLLDKEGRAFVGDFGLAKEVNAEAARGLTVSGAVMGTPGYMSPEQAEGRLKELGPRADIWSLGVMLYEALAGRAPFEAKSVVGVIRAIVSTEPTPPSRVPVRTAAGGAKRARVHPDLETICLKCLEKTPARRYATAGELAEDLRRFLDGEPILAHPSSVAYRGRKWFVRHRVPLGAAGALLLAASVSGSAWRASEAEAAARLAREEGRSRAQAALANAVLVWRSRVEAPLVLAEQVRTLIAAGKSPGEACESNLNPALEADPACFEAWLLRARVRWYLDRPVEALLDADQAVRLRPDDPGARLLRLRLLYFGLSARGPALADAEAAAATQRECAARSAARGYLEWMRGRLLLAQQSFQEAIHLDAGGAEGYCGVAWCQLAGCERPENRGELHAAAFARDPWNPELALQRVRLEADACALEEVCDDARRFLEVWPGSLELPFELAEARYTLADYAGCLEALDKARKTGARRDEALARARRDPPLAWDRVPFETREKTLRARVLLAAGRAEDARSMLEELAAAGRAPWLLAAKLARIDDRPEREEACLSGAVAAGDAGALAEWGGLLQRTGRAAEAGAAFDRATRALAPGHPAMLAIAAIRDGLNQGLSTRLSPAHRPEYYRSLERRLLRLLDACPRVAPAFIALAHVRLVRGEFAQAKKDLDAAVEANPRVAEGWRERGELFLLHRPFRDLERAEADLREAARLDPASLETRLALGVLALRVDHAEEALAAAKAILDARPRWARAWRLRADALEQLGRRDEARAALAAWRGAEWDVPYSGLATAWGEAYVDARKVAAGTEMFTLAIESAPGKSDLYSARGDQYLKDVRTLADGFRDKAWEGRLDPTHDLDLFGRFVTLKTKQGGAAAIAAQYVAQAAKKFPDDPCALFCEAAPAVVGRQHAKGLELLARITVMDPAYVSAWTYRALAALRLGNREESARALERAQALAPDNRLTRLVRAAFLAGGGDRAGAARELESLGRGGAVEKQVLQDFPELAPLREDPSYRSLILGK